MASTSHQDLATGNDPVFWGDRLAVKAAIIGTATIWLLALINIVVFSLSKRFGG